MMRPNIPELFLASGFRDQAKRLSHRVCSWVSTIYESPIAANRQPSVEKFRRDPSAIHVAAPLLPRRAGLNLTASHSSKNMKRCPFFVAVNEVNSAVIFLWANRCILSHEWVHLANAVSTSAKSKPFQSLLQGDG